MLRFVSSFILLFLISEIRTAHDIRCEVKVRDDPFDSGFQKIRTKSVICEFNDAIEITEPTVLANSMNENVTQLLMRSSEKIEFFPQDVAVSFPNLNVIDAYNSSIKSLNHRNFKGLTKVTTVNLARNDLATIDENSFDDMVELRYLNLDENKIVDLPSKVFEKLGNLDSIYLKNNQLINIDAELFKNNKKIALLHLSENKIRTLPSGIFDGFTLMRQVWLKSNEIVELPPHIFDTCESLVDVDLSNNKIKTIDTSLLSKLNSLREVSFSFNPLDFVDLTIFDSNENLSEFFFNGVATKDIRNIEKVDLISHIKGIGFYDTCANGLYHEGNLDKLKKTVKENCIA